MKHHYDEELGVKTCLNISTMIIFISYCIYWKYL